MRKIISLFLRNYDGDRRVRDEIVPGAEWVARGEGVATRKWDGTCVMLRDGRLFKRFEVKPGGSSPAHFEPANDVDPNTGKRQGWVPLTEDAPDDRWHREAFAAGVDAWGSPLVDGTYELCGPKVQGNPEHFPAHVLVPHLTPHPAHTLATSEFGDPPRTFDALKSWLATRDLEGVVWRHPDGRLVKLKKKDFGLPRRPVTM